MPTLKTLDNDNWLPIADALIAKWKECTAPIFVENLSPAGLPTGDAQLLGTGFFVTCRQMTFLVTAAHVIKGLDPKRLLATNVKNQGILLSGLPFVFCHENDLAIAPLAQDWLVNTGLPSLNSIVLDEVWEGYESLEFWITVGYPGSKNGIFPKLRKHAINSHGTSFTEIIQKPTARAHISNPLGFRFDKKKAVDSSNRRTNPPCFSGTSGSPILEVIGRVDTSGNVSLRCTLKGVLLGWHKKEKEVIAGRSEGLVDLIEELLAILEGKGS
ncbi:hypothetical protein [Ectopseudomonas mendocina]|jgi:hypothetical protein|uniref:hypothetical protein n=1 Tax=Ectopseudomonas mendocina TaxID=300 RepID=UPI000E1B5FA9|nr:hypothetical protein [Pseudomonas mendocina]